ncbi:MAG: hypothetical protein QX189_09900, partial [Methylococcales bacterium]
MIPKSITLRLFFSECLVLAAFFALVVLTFDYVVIEGLAKDRLQDFMASLERDVQEAVTSSNEANKFTMPDRFREVLFGDTSSDLHGFIYHDHKKIWQSPS